MTLYLYMVPNLNLCLTVPSVCYSIALYASSFWMLAVCDKTSGSPNWGPQLHFLCYKMSLSPGFVNSGILTF